MHRIFTVVVILVLSPFVLSSWSSEESEGNRKAIRTSPDHFFSKRPKYSNGPLKKRAATTASKVKDPRKNKPAGNLAPLEEDDIDNDETVSVAIGPPPVRPKYEKPLRRPNHQHQQIVMRPTVPINNTIHTASLIVKDVLVTVAKDFVSRKLSPDFVFGQLVANAMSNFTGDTKMKFEHEVLETIMKYQKSTHKGGKDDVKENSKPMPPAIPTIKDPKKHNDTDLENWPDFSNLDKFVKLT